MSPAHRSRTHIIYVSPGSLSWGKTFPLYLLLLSACDFTSRDRVTVFPGAKEETLCIPDVSDVLAKTA